MWKVGIDPASGKSEQRDTHPADTRCPTSQAAPATRTNAVGMRATGFITSYKRGGGENSGPIWHNSDRNSAPALLWRGWVAYLASQTGPTAGAEIDRPLVAAYRNRG